MIIAVVMGTSRNANTASFSLSTSMAAEEELTKGGADVGWNNDAASWCFLSKIVVRELLSSTSMNEFSRFRERERSEALTRSCTKEGEKRF